MGNGQKTGAEKMELTKDEEAALKVLCEVERPVGRIFLQEKMKYIVGWDAVTLESAEDAAESLVRKELATSTRQILSTYTCYEPTKEGRRLVS